MRDVRLTKQIYKHSRIDYETKHIKNWCHYTHKLLRSIGLEHIWQSQEIGDKKSWNTLIKLTMRDREEENWKKEVSKKPKLRTYMKLKTKLKREEYLMEDEVKMRRRLTQLRGGTNELRIEEGRWRKEKIEERVCLMCGSGSVEDETLYVGV